MLASAFPLAYNIHGSRDDPHAGYEAEYEGQRLYLSLLELTVRVLQKNGTRDILDQYIRFCEIQNDQRKKYGYTQKAIEETLRICREEGILTLFLASREKEVKDIMLTLFNQEWVTEVHEKNLVRETVLDNLQNLMDTLGLTPDQAISALKIPASEQSEYRKLLGQGR